MHTTVPADRYLGAAHGARRNRASRLMIHLERRRKRRSAIGRADVEDIAVRGIASKVDQVNRSVIVDGGLRL